MAILDKFHIIRKAVALIQLFACILVFTFSLILLIIGAITVATANSTNSEFYQSSDYVSGGNLLIVSGLFGIAISIIGALGAVPCLLHRQDNLNLWVGLIILIIYILVLVGIFIFEIAAGAWAYNKWDTVVEFLQDELVEDIQDNYNTGNSAYIASVDAVQQEFMCCGIYGQGDWSGSKWSENGNKTNQLPSSCCSTAVPITTTAPVTTSPNATNSTMSPTNSTTAPQNSTTTPQNSTTTPQNSSTTEPENATTQAPPARRRAIFRRDMHNSSMNYTMTTPVPEVICKKSNGYETGCWEQIYNTLSSYTVHIAGVTIALAILQVLILVIPIVLLVIVIIELRRSKSLDIK